MAHPDAPTLFRISKSDQADAPERTFIAKHLGEYNASQAGPSASRALTLAAHNAAGEIVGGLCGKTSHGWLFVELLWVHESVRGHDLGSKLLTDAETEAQKRGCRSAHLDTFSFQALPFYEKHGYEKFGELNDYPLGHRRFFLKKALLS